MDYKYLDKVVDQIVRETEIDYDRGVIKSHFLLSVSSFPSFLVFFHPSILSHSPITVEMYMD